MADYYEKIDQDGAGQGRVHETRSTSAGVQPGRVWADDQTDACQAQYYFHDFDQEWRGGQQGLFERFFVGHVRLPTAVDC